MKIYLNGQIANSQKVVISVFDRGFLYGDGAFESLRTYQGKPFLLEGHLKRLLHTLSELKISPPLSLLNLKKAVRKTMAANKFKEAYIKIIVTRGLAKGHGLSPKNQQGKSQLIIIIEKLAPTPKKIFTQGWSVIISNIKKANLPTAKIKSLCYLDNILAKQEAEKAGADEAILLDQHGNLAEGTVSNIFIVKNKTIYTPPKSGPILPGITRNFVMQLAKQAGLKVIEKNISVKEFHQADERFLTLSSLGVVPIKQPGPITKKLISLYGKST